MWTFDIGWDEFDFMEYDQEYSSVAPGGLKSKLNEVSLLEIIQSLPIKAALLLKAGWY